MHIETRKGLLELKRRYLANGFTNESYPDRWIRVIEECIEDGLAMDETDYENTPKELKKLWIGLK